MATENSDVLVLVADDEPSTLALVASHVRSKGYRVIEASDGDDAWQAAHEHLPDLVVLDVMMPGMSGWEVCRKIREAVSLAHTGIVMLTGIGENLNEMTSPLYGADTYLDKPFEFSDLDAKIEETLSRRRASGEGDDGRDVVTSASSTPTEPRPLAKAKPKKKAGKKKAKTIKKPAKKKAKPGKKAVRTKAKTKKKPAKKKRLAKKQAKKKRPAKKKPAKKKRLAKKKPAKKKRLAKKRAKTKRRAKKRR